MFEYSLHLVTKRKNYSWLWGAEICREQSFETFRGFFHYEAFYCLFLRQKIKNYECSLGTHEINEIDGNSKASNNSLFFSKHHWKTTEENGYKRTRFWSSYWRLRPQSISRKNEEKNTKTEYSNGDFNQFLGNLN